MENAYKKIHAELMYDVSTLRGALMNGIPVKTADGNIIFGAQVALWSEPLFNILCADCCAVSGSIIEEIIAVVIISVLIMRGVNDRKNLLIERASRFANSEEIIRGTGHRIGWANEVLDKRVAEYERNGPVQCIRCGENYEIIYEDV